MAEGGGRRVREVIRGPRTPRLSPWHPRRLGEGIAALGGGIWRPRNPGAQPSAPLHSQVWPRPPSTSDSVSLLQVSGLPAPGLASMKLLCVVAVVGCLLAPPAQANKVSGRGPQHLCALPPRHPSLRPGTRLPSPPLPRAPSPWGVPSGARPQASLWAGRAEGWGSSKDFVFGVETLITAAQGDSRRTMSGSNALYLWSPTQMEVSAGRVTSPMPRQWLGPRSEWIKRLGKPPRLPVGLRR